MSDVLKRYSNFPKYDIWSALLNTISWQIPIFLLYYFFSTTVVGYYSLSMMVIQMPMSLIGGAIAQVFYQRVAEVKLEKTFPVLVENVFKVLIMIGLYPILILTIIGQDIFSVIFGPMWVEAGVYTQILGIWALVWFISSPLSMLYIALEKQEFGLLVTSANFGTRLVSLCIGGWLGSVYIALFLFAISGIFVYGFLCLKLLKYSGANRNNIKKIIFANGILFLPAGIILLTLKILNVNPLIIVGISGLILTIYYGYIISSDGQIKNLVDTVLKRNSC